MKQNRLNVFSNNKYIIFIWLNGKFERNIAAGRKMNIEFHTLFTRKYAESIDTDTLSALHCTALLKLHQLSSFIIENFAS